MSYNAEQAREVGRKLHALLLVLADGIDMGDIDEVMALGQAAGAAADEFQADKDATIFYALTGAMDSEAGRRLGQ